MAFAARLKANNAVPGFYGYMAAFFTTKPFGFSIFISFGRFGTV
jgi:hypothetical protein